MVGLCCSPENNLGETRPLVRHVLLSSPRPKVVSLPLSYGLMSTVCLFLILHRFSSDDLSDSSSGHQTTTPLTLKSIVLCTLYFLSLSFFLLSSLFSLFSLLDLKPEMITSLFVSLFYLNYRVRGLVLVNDNGSENPRSSC